MSRVKSVYETPADLLLGLKDNPRVLLTEQKRQRREVEEILQRLKQQPGVILGDEVGMGKTFVALAVAYSVSVRDRRAPVVIMVPSNLVEKWRRDLDAFCKLYLNGIKPLDVAKVNDDRQFRSSSFLKYGIALHSVDFLKLFAMKTKFGWMLPFVSDALVVPAAL